MRSIKIRILFAALLFAATPANAQKSRYETPEYSGPSARMDEAFDHYHKSQQNRRDMFNRNRDLQQIRRNDLYVDTQIEQRHKRVQLEMQRKREETYRQTINE